jgi:tetratricopeptide (TPR) repeat protein/predicted O-methyltransferase YrrM
MSNYLIKALAICEEALQGQSENQAQWQMNCRKIGNILQSMGWFDEAVLWHSRLLETQHDLVEIYKDLALLYTRLENFEQAIICYEKVLQINPNHSESYLTLSRIHAKLDNKEQENECLFQVLTLQPPQKIKPEGYYKLGKKFHELAKHDRAITCYLRSIENQPQLLNAYFDLAEIYVLEGDWEKAINTYEQLLEQDKKQALAYYNIGQLWWKQEKYQEAINYLIKAAFLEPKLAESYFNFAITLIQKDKLDEVINLCRSLIGAKIINAWTYIQMGNALVKKGQLKDASLCYQQAAKMRGWDDCAKKDYQFTKDFFNHKIDIFKIYLQQLVGQPLIHALEIGCQEGMSACWLLDNVLTEATAKLTCIEPQFSDLFHANITKTGVKEKVILLQGNSLKILGELTPNSFDLIYIQDKGKTEERVQKITRLSWQLCKQGGIIIFDNYGLKSNENLKDKTPQQIIDNFLNRKNTEFETLYQNQQLIIKKLN